MNRGQLLTCRGGRSGFFGQIPMAGTDCTNNKGRLRREVCRVHNFICSIYCIHTMYIHTNQVFDRFFYCRLYKARCLFLGLLLSLTSLSHIWIRHCTFSPLYVSLLAFFRSFYICLFSLSSNPTFYIFVKQQ